MTSTIETPTDQKSKEEEKDWIDNVCEKTTNLLCPVPDDLPEALAAAENKKEEADEERIRINSDGDKQMKMFLQLI